MEIQTRTVHMHICDLQPWCCDITQRWHEGAGYYGNYLDAVAVLVRVD